MYRQICHICYWVLTQVIKKYDKYPFIQFAFSFSIEILRHTTINRDFFLITCIFFIFSVKLDWLCDGDPNDHHNVYPTHPDYVSSSNIKVFIYIALVFQQTHAFVWGEIPTWPSVKVIMVDIVSSFCLIKTCNRWPSSLIKFLFCVVLA